MRNRIAIGIAACLFLCLPFTAAGEDANRGIDIRVNGVPLEDAIGSACGVFADAVGENIGEMIDGLNNVFSEFTLGFSESLDEIGDMLPDESGAPMETFCYSNSGSSTYEIYSYEVGRNEDTGEWTVICELHCGYEPYILPADEALIQELIRIIDAHSLRKWDGFNASDSMVLDGSGFSLDIGFADGSAIHAHGSNSFPDGFGEAKRAIDELFRTFLEKNGITPEGGF